MFSPPLLTKEGNGEVKLWYNSRMAGLYLHIPFCAKKCHYCNFVVTTSDSPGERGEFLDRLGREAAHYSPRFRGVSFDTLYLGGGTPSRLHPPEIEEVFRVLRSYFSFREDAEVTFEANPGDTGPGKARLWRALGVNRVSLGVQSFQEETLKKINRSHGAREIGESFSALREAGFDNISADLMLSLPGQTVSDTKNSLEALLRFGPEHVSLYELVVEEKTVFGALRRQGRLDLPDEETQVDSLGLARSTLKDAGYRHYELLSYARPGRESRHNRIYWDNEEYLGLGPGAFSYLDGRRYRNSRGVDEYLDKIRKGDWTASEEETLTAEKKEIESLLLALRLEEGADIRRFSRLVDRFAGPIGDLREKGLLESAGDRLRLTPRGQLFAETVFAELSG
ncbi:MAG: radical SAM family heme chaperone HemW [Candidatus Omnitrophica bacterium]|nr:radical SAM family heme chaperone HemW [Candidatus Omnitrophota bacterium]